MSPPGSGGPSPLVEIRNVSVAYGRHRVLSGISLRVARGERVALLGPNGAGKSTLIDLLLGLRAPDEGSVRVFGQPPPAADVGFVPQEPGASLLPWFRVDANVLLPLRAKGTPERACRKAFEAVRLRLDPEGRLDVAAFPARLSGGQRQLVALMRGLVGQPRLLVCDEPFSALDAPSRVRLRAVLAGACSAPDGPALLLVSHDQDDVLSLADRAVVLTGQPATRGRTVDLRSGGGRAELDEVLAEG